MSEWIPVTEKKPERSQRVLVKFLYRRISVWKEYTMISTAQYNGDDWWFIDFISTEDDVDPEVISWMPLPIE